MADSYKANYSCSYTPVHVDEYLQDDHYDTSLNKTYTKNIVMTQNGSSSCGGGMQNMEDGVSPGDDSTLCGASAEATTTSYQDIKGAGSIPASNKDVYLLAIKITAADAGSTDATCDCIISLDTGSSGHLHIVGKGSAIVVPLAAGIQTNDVMYKSSGAGTKCELMIQILKDAD